METIMIAPCGINCSLCRAHLRKKKPCAGCAGTDVNKANHCITCRIRNCEELTKENTMFCYSCSQFPCKLIKHLDERYQRRYGLSNIQNLETIRKDGIEYFQKSEIEKWTCKTCGSLLCIHKDLCLSCGNKNPYYPIHK